MIPEIEIPSIVVTILQVILAFSGAFFMALWVSLVVWTFRDSRSRSRDVFAIMLSTLMVVFFGPLGLVLYFLLRPPITLAELYERSLEEEALLQDIEERPRCPGCSRIVNEAWVVCPDCHTQLKKSCPNCSQVLELTWSLCPFCATQVETPIVYGDNNSSSGRPSPSKRDRANPAPAKRPVGVAPPLTAETAARRASAEKTRPQAPQVG